MALEDPYFLPGISRADVTIGVELEMVLVNTWGVDAFKLVRNSLRDLADNLDTSVPPFKQFMRKKCNVPTADPFAVFQVKTDPTISCDYWEIQEISATPVEIATPILRNWSWKWVIPDMCQAITSLAAPNLGIQVAFNSSTGLHVHIGIGRPYTLAELKRIAKAIVLFEAQMDRYHPICRVPEEDLGSCFRSCRNSLALRGLTNSEMLDVIDRCGKTEDLLCTINGLGKERSYQRFYRYNFLPVQTYGTIEFRQAMGTKDPQWIVNWITIVIRFVTRAVKTSDDIYAVLAKSNDIPPEIYRSFGAPSPVGYGKSGREKAPKRKAQRERGKVKG